MINTVYCVSACKVELQNPSRCGIQEAKTYVNLPKHHGFLVGHPVRQQASQRAQNVWRVLPVLRRTAGGAGVRRAAIPKTFGVGQALDEDLPTIFFLQVIFL